MKREIIWQKWINPMDVVEDEDFPEFVNEKDADEFEKIYNDKTEDVTIYKAKPAAITPFGLIPINPHNDPAKNFDYWIGHTNFYIGTKTATIIEGTPGVEIFDIFGPYRFRISVGKAFKFSDVRVALETRLQTLNPPKINVKDAVLPIDVTLKEKIFTKIDEIKKNDYWVVYVLPNGEIEISLPKDSETFKHRKQILLNTRELAGGLLLSSDEYGV